MDWRTMTIDQAILALQRARECSPLGGDTVLVVSLTASELEQSHVNEVALVTDPDGGALVEIRTRHEALVTS